MTDKPEVHYVATQVRAPKGPGDPGAVVEGAYTVTDNTVTLTDRAGNPVRDQHGKLYTRKLEKGDVAKALAARLTKDFRLMLRGKDGKIQGFTGPIRYPRLVVV